MASANLTINVADLPVIGAALQHAANVMAMLEGLGPGIVGHLIDTDDNEGQRLRECLGELGIEATAEQKRSIEFVRNSREQNRTNQ